MLTVRGWIVIYLLQLLISSTAAGCVAVHLPRQLNGTRLSRFLLGFTVTPFLIAVGMLILATVLPGGPRIIFYSTPAVLSIPVLVKYGIRTLRRLFREWRRIRAETRDRWPFYFMYFCALLLGLVVVPKLIMNARSPLLAHDVKSHMEMALPFANARSIGSIPDFDGSIDEPTAWGSHSYLYQAFFAQALMTRGSDNLGYPNDDAARAGVQILIFYMFLSTVALASVSRRLGAGAFAFILLLQAQNLDFLSYFDHRDPFRIIPLVLLGIVLSGFSAQRLRRKVKVSHLMPCLILSAFSLSAHTLNLVVVPLIVGAWLLWALIERAPITRMLVVIGAVVIGFSIAGLHYVKTYIDTGTPTGYGYQLALANSPLREAYSEMRGITRVEDTGFLYRIRTVLGQDEYKLSLQGLFVALFSLLLWFKDKSGRLPRNNLLMGIIIIIGTLPFTGLMDIPSVGAKLSDMFVLNTRYVQYLYPFCAACIALTILYLHQKAESSKGRSLLIYIFVVVILLCRAPTVFLWLRDATKWEQISSFLQYYGLYAYALGGTGAAIVLLWLHRKLARNSRKNLTYLSAALVRVLYFVTPLLFLSLLVFMIRPRPLIPFFLTLAALLTAYLIKKLANKRESRQTVIPSYILIFFIFIVSMASWKAAYSWRVNTESRIRRHHIWKVKEIVDKLSPDYRILHDVHGTAYFLDCPAVFVFSPSARQIVQAKEPAEIEAALRSFKIKYVLLEFPIWRETALIRYLNNPVNATMLGTGKEIYFPYWYWWFYEIKGEGTNAEASGGQAETSTDGSLSE